MIPYEILDDLVRHVRNDRASWELHDYVRGELGGDTSWLRGAEPSRPWRVRFRAWLRRGPAAVAGPPRPESPGPTAAPVSVASAALLEDCAHPDAEDLGSSGAVEFLRCRACGGILVVAPGKVWGFASDVPREERETACV